MQGNRPPQDRIRGSSLRHAKAGPSSLRLAHVLEDVCYGVTATGDLLLIFSSYLCHRPDSGECAVTATTFAVSPLASWWCG